MNRIAQILALSLVVAGCSTSSSPDEATAVAQALVGDWQDICFTIGNSQYAQLTFHIATGTWDVDYDVYGDAACSAALADIHIAGTFQILEPSTVVAGANDAIFSFTTRTVTPQAQPFADYLNTVTGCGAGNWQVGVSEDVYATGCTALGSYPESNCTADYDVVKVSGGTLQFGERPADNDMCTADKRPSALNPDALHKR